MSEPALMLTMLSVAGLTLIRSRIVVSNAAFSMRCSPSLYSPSLGMVITIEDSPLPAPERDIGIPSDITKSSIEATPGELSGGIEYTCLSRTSKTSGFGRVSPSRPRSERAQTEQSFTVFALMFLEIGRASCREGGEL